MFSTGLLSRKFHFFVTAALLTGLAFKLSVTPSDIVSPGRTIEVWARPGIAKGYYFMAPYNLRKTGETVDKSTLMIFNENGSLLYYKRLKLGSDFKVHSGGSMSYYSSGIFYVMNSSFRVIDSVRCIADANTDSHDFLILPNGNYLLIGKKTVVEDMSDKAIFMKHRIRGSKKAKVKYDVIQELDKNKKLVFEWDSRQVYRIEDANTYYLTDTAVVDVTHFNSVDIDENGDLLISVRFFDEVIKIKRFDGSVIWRMGGKRNQIKVLNDTLPFLGQHDARFSGPGRFTLFDNGFGYDSLRHNPRGVEYMVDDRTKTARLLWQHRSEFPIVCSSAGNLQRLSGGNTLIGYGKQDNKGNKLAFEILDSLGKEQTQGWYADSLSTYRTFFYGKLPFELNRPVIVEKKINGQWRLCTERHYAVYRWNTGETSNSIAFKNSGRCYVDVSNDGESFFRSDVK